jgi:hypothetical protein
VRYPPPPKGTLYYINTDYFVTGDTMSARVTNALLTLAGTFVTALIAAGKMPAEMAEMGWYNALWGPGLQSILMFLGAMGFQTAPVQRLLGR